MDTHFYKYMYKFSLLKTDRFTSEGILPHSSKLVRLIPGLHERRLPEIENSLSEWTTSGISAHEIKQIYRPQGWNNVTLKYDLAIVVLKTPITFNKKVQPIHIDWIDPDIKGFEGFLQSITILKCGNLKSTQNHKLGIL